MSSSTALLELANNKAIITRLLEKEIATDYSYRGAIFKRPSPIDFSAQESRQVLHERASTMLKSAPEKAALYGRVAMKSAIRRAIDASTELKALSDTIREILVDLFSSANVMRMEAAGHHPYPSMSSNDDTALYAIIATVSASRDGPAILDRWVCANLKHVLEHMSRVPSVRKAILLSLDPSTGRLATYIRQREEKNASKKRVQGDLEDATPTIRQPLKLKQW